MRCSRLLVVAVVLFSSAGLSAAAGGSQETPATCPVTRPPNPPFVAPLPYPPSFTDKKDFWYGTPSLWTLLTVPDLRGRCGVGPTCYTTKLIYWSSFFDWRRELEPELVVTARRLDRRGSLVSTEHANAVFVPRTTPGMMTGIDIPTAGCWELTARYRGHTLSYVVSVEP